ncbi:MAG: hypothetical protein ACM3X9_07730 [Bacillota bacterium]
MDEQAVKEIIEEYARYFDHDQVVMREIDDFLRGNSLQALASLVVLLND